MKPSGRNTLACSYIDEYHEGIFFRSSSEENSRNKHLNYICSYQSLYLFCRFGNLPPYQDILRKDGSADGPKNRTSRIRSKFSKRLDHTLLPVLNRTYKDDSSTYTSDTVIMV